MESVVRGGGACSTSAQDTRVGPDLAKAVADLITRRHPEDLRTEYKATLAEDEERFLPTVSAFANDLANLNGGVVIIGIAEEEGMPVLRGVPAIDVDRTRRRVVELTHRIKPEYAPVVEVVVVDGHPLIAVRCPGGDNRPYTVPYKGAPSLWVRRGSVTEQAKGELERQLREVSARTPYDDQLRHELTSEVLSLPLLLHHLRESGSSLGSSNLDADTLYQKLDLVRRSNGHLSPRNVSLLFFTPEPTRWLRGALIEIVLLPAGRAGATLDVRRFDGPLPAQVRSALDYLRNLIPRRVIKHPDRAEASVLQGWPYDAVEEALINAVYHRGYDVPDPTNVQIGPDSIRITSYPGPNPGLAAEHLERDDAPHVPARNRRIADLLAQVRLVEAQGTGVPKIRAAMAQNGSPPPRFRFDEDRTFFEVTLPIHPAFMERKGQALHLARPAPPADVVGREGLVAHLWSALETQDVALLGFGRGASSVLGVLAASPPAGWRAVLLDLRERSFREAARLLATAAAEAAEVQDSNVVLLIDNVADVWRDDAGDDLSPIIAHLRELVQANPRLSVLLVGDTEGWTWLEPLVLPPLSHDATADLATRLLMGADLPQEVAVVEALVAASAGLPQVLVRLVHGVIPHRRHLTPDHVEDALDALITQRGDPAGLRAMVDRVEGAGPPEVLDELARAPEGLRRRALVTSVSEGGLTRTQAVDAIQRLELSGVVVEVDGLLRFEHPLARERWMKRGGAPA
jgi:predicted HTH transcriptional regulator